MVILLFLIGFIIVRKIVRKYYATHWDDNLYASVYFDNEAVSEGDTGHICEELVNGKFLPLPVVNVKFDMDKSIYYKEKVNSIVSDKQYRSDTLSLGSNTKLVRSFEVQFTKRGMYSIDSVDLNTMDPVDSYIRSENYECDSVIYVYPRYSHHRDILAPFSRIMGEALKNKFIFEDPFEFKGIRNYTTSDPMKKINWSASAKTGQLLVNNYYDTTSRHVTIFLDVVNDSVWKRNDQLEECIRITRNLMEEFVKNQVPVKIFTNAKSSLNGDIISMESGTGSGVVYANLRNMALIDLDKETEPIAEYLSVHESNSEELSILLSADLSERLVTAYEKYLGKNSGEWIAPVMSSKDCNIRSSKFNITYLEVERL